MRQNLGRVQGTTWYTGTGITGTPTTPTVFVDSGVTYALEHDLYLNDTTGNVYSCTLEGNASTAKWVYNNNIMGPVADIVDNLRTDSATKALSARQGKVLNEKILSSGVYAKSIDINEDTTAYIAEITLHNVEGTVTLTDGTDTGTYAFTPIGVAEQYTISIDIGTDIGFSQEGAVIKNVTFTDSIFRIKLKDINGDTFYDKTYSAWDSIKEALEQITVSGTVTDGSETLRLANILKVVNGNSTSVYPKTHDKAVWHDKANSVTVHAYLETIFNRVLAMEAKTTTFNQNGTITTTYSDCSITTTFNQDGTITDVLKDSDNTTVATKTTTFNQDGSISEVVTTPV